MLGNVICKKIIDEAKENSTIVRSTIVQDLLLEKWSKNNSDSRLATLVPQDETWKEFWLYASGTKYWCPRLCAIKSFVKINDIVNAEGLWNMEYGKAVHSVFQKSALPSLGVKFLGAWKKYFPLEVPLGKDFEHKIFKLVRSSFWNQVNDDEDRHIVRGWGTKPEGKDWEYDEVKIRMLKYRIVSKLDAILLINDEEEVFELKTEKVTARDDLDPCLGGAARIDHVNQVQLGMWATDIHRSRIVYKFKEVPYFKSSLMEHQILYDESIVDRLKRLALMCVEAVRMCDKYKMEVEVGKPFFKDEASLYGWLEDRFDRLQDCQLKSKGRPKYCPGRDICFPKGYRRKK